MRIAIVALVLVSVALLILVIADMLTPAGISNLSAGPAILLLCIPVSLALFAFLAHHQNEQLKLKKQREQERQQITPAQAPEKPGE